MSEQSWERFLPFLALISKKNVSDVYTLNMDKVKSLRMKLEIRHMAMFSF